MNFVKLGSIASIIHGYLSDEILESVKKNMKVIFEHYLFSTMIDN